MGRMVMELLRRRSRHAHIIAVAVRGPMKPSDAALLPQGTRVVYSPEQLPELDPADLVVECAGRQALRQYGPRALSAGCDLLVASIGALADPELEQQLGDAAASSGARVLVPSGALGGLDLLAAARISGVDAVTYTGRKPPLAWRDTRAEALTNLDTVTADAPFFSGSARVAALTFPQNANVAAAVAIAGIGFDATQVRLFADPNVSQNEHCVHASGAFGSFELTVRATALAQNPKTSLLAPCSLVRRILDRSEAVSLA